MSPQGELPQHDHEHCPCVERLKKHVAIAEGVEDNLVESNERMRAALAWYADETTWICPDDAHVGHCGPEDCMPAIDSDMGERARNALTSESPT